MFCLSQNLWITTSIKWSQQAQGWGNAHDGHHTAGEGPRQSSGQAQSDIQSCWHCGGCQQKAPLEGNQNEGGDAGTIPAAGKGKFQK